METKLLRLHPNDHVAVATSTLFRGASVQIDGEHVTCLDEIPFGHKVAVRQVAAGETIFKYGFAIGRASADIPSGTHVHIHNCRSTRGRQDPSGEDGRCAVSLRGPCRVDAPRDAVPLPPMTGYRRADGRVGIRNHVLVLPTVQCANGIVERVGRSIPGVVALPHEYGCSQIGADFEQTARVLEAFAGHPNVGAVLLVSLGCETVDASALADRLTRKGQLVELLTIQREGGTRSTYEKAVKLVQRMLEGVRGIERVPLDPSDLVIGVECGGSDAWSGVTANPAVGIASDLVVAAGGTVILSEVTEFIGAEHILAGRAASEAVAGEVLRVVREREDAVRAGRLSAGGEASESPDDLAPGNVEGGLTTIEEKSLGAIAKGGTTSVKQVLAYGRAPTEAGLVIMNTAGNDPESVTGMVAGGAQIVLFTTGRGSPTGCPIAPTLKIATNAEMFTALRDDMDVNAGTLLEGDRLEDLGRRIAEETAAVACGKLTAAERGGHAVFAIERLGPKV